MTDTPDPVEGARTPEPELFQHDRGKYTVHSEIAHGGMGVVLRSHDTELGRDVAIKVLDPALAEREEVRQRFIEEAQIGGQLQHPGIVPVYELGLMADGRPWFAMKLVKGRTLEELLAERETAEVGRGKLLAVFEAICQTVAYAHSKDVIHRDLKPANVMVGAFGEVQVVDWGLAKVLSGEVSGKTNALPRESLMTMIETVRSKEGSSGSSASIVGSVLGTPAYMPPEQAQGNIEGLDARADVFALGAILCEVLTGKPIYVAEKGGPTVLELAADAALDPALARLKSAPADDELKQLCQRCLAPGRGSRPKDAGEVAEAVRDHIARTQERVHRAELDAERATRRVQVTLLAASLVVVALAGGGGGAWWLTKQRAERAAEFTRAFDAAQTEILQASREGDHARALELATDALRRVEAGEPHDELRQRADDVVLQAEERLKAELEQQNERLRLARFDDFLEAVDTGRLVGGNDEERLAAYEAGFAEFGIVLDDSQLSDVLEEHRYTDRGTRIARGLDVWGQVLRRQQDADRFHVDLLAGIGLDLDPDPVRADVRQALVARDAAVLLEMYESADLDALPPETIHVIGRALFDLGQLKESCQVLSRAADLHPSDFLLNHDAGMANAAEGNLIRARELLRVAFSMRPNNIPLLEQLSTVCSQLGDYLGAWETDLLLIRLQPDQHGENRSWSSIADDAWFLGRWKDARHYYDRDLDARRVPSTAIWKSNVEAYGGIRTREEVLTELENDAHPGDRNARLESYVILLVVVPDGNEPDPERALALAGEWVSANGSGYIGQAATYARLGRGEDVLRVIDIATTAWRQRPPNHHNQALLELMSAVGHSLLGDAERADYHLRSARSTRATLIAGREDAWSESWMQMCFEQFEPMVD